MLEILQDTLIDTITLLPFLFITYLLMEYIEHKMSKKTKTTIKKSGKLGPLIGGLVGIIPQCGFSASATNLYAARVISLGTLISVYLATSDEMLPILISETVPISTIIQILIIKFVIGFLCGFIIDFILQKKNANITQTKITHICKNENCHCDKDGIFKSSVKHTINITIYIFIITFIINIIVDFVGEEQIANFISNYEMIGPIIASLIGLIPNCVASVILADLYVQGIINIATMIAGLLTGTGVGLIVLFKINKNIKENIGIVILLYVIGAVSGILIQIFQKLLLF